MSDQGKPGYTPENWLALTPPEGTTVGDLLPVSFRPLPIPYKDAGKAAPGSVHWFKDENGNWIVPNFFRGAINDLALTLAAPRNAYLGKYTPEEMENKLALPMTSTLMGAGMGMPAPANSSRIFAGLYSKTANSAKLGEAAQAYAEAEAHFGKVTPDMKAQILKDTGWFQDVDDEWKYEIPDWSHAQLKLGAAEKAALGDLRPPGWSGPENELISLPQSVRLGDILDHPPLYEAYPWLKDSMVMPSTTAGAKQYMGRYLPNLRAFEMSPAKPDDFLSTLLHEIQHGVQHHEGFGWGANVDMFLPAGHAELMEKAAAEFYDAKLAANEALGWKGDPDKIGLAMRKMKNPTGLFKSPTSEERELVLNLSKNHPEIFSRLSDAMDNSAELGNQRAEAFDKYWSAAGEGESRNVQARWEGMYGRRTPPWKTAGYPGTPQTVVKYPAWGKEEQKAAATPTGAAELPPEADSFVGWHGTPHEFEPVDENPFGVFRDDKIGSGEGAQVYGHGHYVAGVPETAKEYQERLGNSQYFLGDEALPKDDFYHNWLVPLVGENDTIEEAIEGAKKAAASATDNYYGAVNEYNAGRLPYERLKLASTELEEAQRAFETISHPDFRAQKGGHLLKTVVTPEEEELLHWDKPFSEQSPQVQDAFRRLRDEGGFKFNEGETGEELYHGLIEMVSGHDPADLGRRGRRAAAKEASSILQQTGVPGIRYFDQLSRGVRPELHFGEERINTAFPRLEELEHDTSQTIFDYSPQELATSIAKLEINRDESNPAKGVQYALRHMEGELAYAKDTRVPGSHVYREGFNLHPRTEEHWEEAINWLKENKDKFTFKTPKQTHNYVIFDPKHIRIVGKNGKLLPQSPDDPFDVGGWPW